LNVSSRENLHEALLATGFSTYDKSALKEQLRVFSTLVSDVRGIRRAGSAAYDLCMVAEGVFDAYWERNLSPWDTAAGTVLVREAGGVVTNYESRGDGRDSKSYTPFDKSIVAGNLPIHKQVLERIRQCRV